MEDTNQLDPRMLAAMSNNGMGQSNIIRFQLELDNDLESLRMDLLGLDYDEQTGELKESEYKWPKINRHGADVIISLMRPRLSRITSMSNLEEEAISKRCHQFADGLTFVLGAHYHEFDIPSLQMMDVIIDLCDDMFYTSAMKAIKGWQGDSINKQHVLHESEERVLDQRKDAKKSSIPSPLGFFRTQT